MLAAASLLPLSAPAPSCECCAATRDALLGYCEEQRPMGDLGLDAFRCEDYFGNLATHGDTSSRPTAKDACLDEYPGFRMGFSRVGVNNDFIVSAEPTTLE